MKVELLAIGTELLMGQIANTNAQYISKRLPDAGHGVYYHSVVGDNPERVKECLKLAMSRCRAVIITGGLGPTQDDLTKETVAEAVGRKMVFDEESAEMIKEYFAAINGPMVESNMRQAYFPEGSIILRNERGTAPGCIVETDENIIVMLPGPPKEMQPMFESHVLPYFKSKSELCMKSNFVKITGMGESSVEKELMKLIDHQTNPTFATYAKDGEVTLRVTASTDKGEPESKADGLLKNALNEIYSILGDKVYSTEDESLEEVVYKLFKSKQKTFALAESCTGGALSERLTSVPGISEVYGYGTVVYSNEAKIKLLGVKPETLTKYGAVSYQTAIEMAEGVKSISGAYAGISITGIAGPASDGTNKPVGLVYIAVSYGKKTLCYKYSFTGNRERIRTLSVVNALDTLRKIIR